MSREKKAASQPSAVEAVTQPSAVEAVTQPSAVEAVTQPSAVKAVKLGLAGSVALHVLLIGVAVAWGIHRSSEWAAERQLPPLRNEPLAIDPLYDDEDVISDEQLRRVLSRLGLRLQGSETVLGHIDHSLRFWGSGAEFADPEWVSGEEMRRILTDHRRYAEVYGAEQEPLLIDDGDGVRFRTQEGIATSSHFDHTLACLGEVGTPLDYPVVTPRRSTTVRVILEQALRDFSLNNSEYEWSSLVLALYLPPVNRWITSEGQEVTFDRLAERIMREQLPGGVCSGNHRLHALVTFLRVDDLMHSGEQPPMLSADGRRRIVEFLQAVTEKFVRHQHADGFWNADWPSSAPAGSEPDGSDRDRLSDRLIATGHVLEWWALSPPEIHPPRPVVVAAGQWLVRTVDAMSAEQIRQNLSYLSHVGRALTLWRGRSPGDVDLDSPPHA